MTTPETGDEVWAGLVGQEEAAARLQAAARAPVHAYLFAGPHGSGKRAGARAFAAALLSQGLDHEAADRARRLALAEQHPDLVVIEPDSTVWRFPKEGDSPGLRLVKAVMSSPVEASRKVVVATGFHLARDEAIGKLLKVIEEPPDSSVVVLLAEEVPPEQATIASRCARVDFGPVRRAAIVEYLASLGVAGDRAEMAAGACGGDLDRAELLATDVSLEQRSEAWRSVPGRLDGRGSTVVALVAELREQVDAAQAPVVERHQRELEEIDERSQRLGLRAGARKEVVDRQKREVRRLREAEIRFGLATLAGPYRDRLATADRPDRLVASLEAVQAAAEALERNPIEALLLEALLVSLGPLG